MFGLPRRFAATSLSLLHACGGATAATDRISAAHDDKDASAAKDTTPSNAGADRDAGAGRDAATKRQPYECNLFDGFPCTETELVAHDVSTDLGFSPNDVLDLIVGSHEISLAWIAPCEGDTGCPSLSKCAAEAALPSLAGTLTTLRVDVEVTGEPASAKGPSEAQPVCLPEMTIPARVRLRSADSAIDGTHEVPIWTQCGNSLSVNLETTAAELGGTLDTVLPASARMEFHFSTTYDGRLSLFLVGKIAGETTGEKPFALAGILISDGTCPDDVPRQDVLVP